MESDVFEGHDAGVTLRRDEMRDGGRKREANCISRFQVSESSEVFFFLFIYN